MLRLILSITTFIVWSLGMVGTAFAHPSDGYPARPLQSGYGEPDYGFPSSFSFNDITFVQYPQANTLSEQEKYMLSGTSSGPWGYALPAWYISVFQAVQTYYKKHQVIPASFSPEMFLEFVADPSSIQQDYLDLFKSPLTGDWPLLNAQSYSPGNMYIRVLTEDEMQYYADLNPVFQELWFDGVFRKGDGTFENVKMISNVFYVRVYGLNGVIYNGLLYGWASK